MAEFEAQKKVHARIEAAERYHLELIMSCVHWTFAEMKHLDALMVDDIEYCSSNTSTLHHRNADGQVPNAVDFLYLRDSSRWAACWTMIFKAW